MDSFIASDVIVCIFLYLPPSPLLLLVWIP
jgi:hypothetical protein